MLYKSCSFPALLAALSLFVSTAEAGGFVLGTFHTMVSARMDPVVSPGLIAQHSHTVVGASGFSAIYNPDQLRQSKCTNLPLQADKSNYWVPQIFQILKNGSYVAMSTGTRVYYNFNSPDIEPFPYDLKFVWGDPARKTFDDTKLLDITSGYNCGNPASGKATYGTYSLPKERCEVLTMKVLLPSCTSGKFDQANPSAHMAFTTDGWDGLKCPDTHPIRIPSIAIETFHWTTHLETAPEGEQQYVLANGDTTGYGLHGDFTNGWDEDILRDIVIAKCANPPAGDSLAEICPELAPHIDQDLANSCSYEGLRPDESVGRLNDVDLPMIKLPGCNLPWASGSKPTCFIPRRGRLSLPVTWIKTKLGTLFP